MHHNFKKQINTHFSEVCLRENTHTHTYKYKHKHALITHLISNFNKQIFISERCHVNPTPVINPRLGEDNIIIR